MKSLFSFLWMLLLTCRVFANSVGEDVNNFAYALFSKVEDKEENLVFSPYSMFTNLALLYFGAKGQTASQIKSALHLSEGGKKFLDAFRRHFQDLTQDSNHGYQLHIKNALFPHKGTHFLTHYKELATSTFNAKLQAVDFANPNDALHTINKWVADQTQGKIPILLTEQDVDNSTRLVVANACFFQGEWVYPFQKRMMRISPFYHDDGTSIKADYLHQTHSFPYYEEERLQAVALPFVRRSTDQPFLECLIILPREGKLTELEKSLTIQEIDTILHKSQPKLVHLAIPKFCFSTRLELNEPLKALGMILPFSYAADFSNIDGMKDLFLNKVVHETYFSFNEMGVTASSATGSSLGVTSAPSSIDSATLFEANHPFLFLIVDTHSRAVLFMGHVIDPESRECDAN